MPMLMESRRCQVHGMFDTIHEDLLMSKAPNMQDCMPIQVGAVRSVRWESQTVYSRLVAPRVHPGQCRCGHRLVTGKFSPTWLHWSRPARRKETLPFK